MHKVIATVTSGIWHTITHKRPQGSTFLFSCANTVFPLDSLYPSLTTSMIWDINNVAKYLLHVHNMPEKNDLWILDTMVQRWYGTEILFRLVIVRFHIQFNFAIRHYLQFTVYFYKNRHDTVWPTSYRSSPRLAASRQMCHEAANHRLVTWDANTERESSVVLFQFAVDEFSCACISALYMTEQKPEFWNSRSGWRKSVKKAGGFRQKRECWQLCS